MAISISGSSNQSTNAAANQSTVNGYGSMTLTVGSWSGLQSHGTVNIGGNGYDIGGPTAMSQGGSWSWSASTTFTHDANSGYRGAVGVSVSHYIDGTTLHRGSADGGTQGAIDYDRSANAPYYNNITRNSTTNIYVTYARTGSVNGPTTYVLERATDAGMSQNYTTFGEGDQTVDSTTSYYFRMYAYGTEGGNKYSGVYGPYYGVPTAPTSVVGTASPSVSGRITVSWNTPSTTNGTISNYYVYRGGTYIGQTGNSSTSYIDDGLTKGTSYSYTVVAYNSAGASVASSASIATQAPGVPYAPTLDTAVVSTDTFGKVTLNWTKPTTAVGTISDYYLYADGVVVASVSGENTGTGVITGLTPRQTYTFTVRARNAFAISNGLSGDASNGISRKSPGPPSAPTSLASSAPFVPPGTVDLSWTAPTDVGTTGGTITGYNVYLSGSSTPIKTTVGTGTSTTIEDLVPATTYTFVIRARNAIADIVGTFSDLSNTTTATAQGEPDAPANLTVSSDPLVAGRLVLTWTPPVGYNTGFRIYTGDGVLVANVSTPRLEIDGLTTNTSYSYKVRARNPLTDQTNSEGGPFSATVSGTVGSSSTQTVPNISATNSTNTALVGSYTLASTTATTFSYNKTASNIAFASVPVSGGSTVNNTNTNLNGTYVIGVPTPTSVTFTRAGADIIANTSTPSGTMNDNTNVTFNGSYTVLGSPAPDSVAKTVSYTKVASDVSSRAVTGTITNNSNAVFNGQHTITGATENTISYARTNTNIAESNAFGIVENKTNKDIFNGSFTLSDTPDHKTIEYSTGDLTYGENLITNPSMETVQSGSTILRTNLCSNPGFETNVTGWTGTSASIARSGAYFHSGAYSGLVTPGSTSGSVAATATTVSGLPHMLSVWVYSEEATTVRLSVVSPAITGTTTSIPADTWTRVSLSFTSNTTTTTYAVATVGSTQPFYIDNVLLEQTSELRPYFDGATTDALGWDYGWTGTANASTSTAKALTTAQRTNLIPNPSFQNDLTSWSISGFGATGTISTSESYVGTKSAYITAGMMGGEVHTGSPGNIPVTVGTQYTASAWVKRTPGVQTFVSVGQFNSSNGSVASNVGTLTHTTSDWERVSVTVTIQATTVNARVSVGLNTANGTGYVDAVQFEVGSSASSYFDGSFAGASWAGTAHASASTTGGTNALPVGLTQVSSVIMSTYARSHSGSLSALVAPSSNTGGASLTQTTVAGTVYTFSAWVYSDSAKNMKLSADSTVGTTVAVPATTWTRLSLSFTAEDTSTLLSILGTDSTTSFYLDDVMLEASSTLSAYFDGDTDATATTWPVVYSWAGTSHASISTREVGETLPSSGAEILPPYGAASREQSEAQLQIRYRSGWLG